MMMMMMIMMIITMMRKKLVIYIYVYMCNLMNVNILGGIGNRVRGPPN